MQASAGRAAHQVPSPSSLLLVAVIAKCSCVCAQGLGLPAPAVSPDPPLPGGSPCLLPHLLPEPHTTVPLWLRASDGFGHGEETRLRGRLSPQAGCVPDSRGALAGLVSRSQCLEQCPTQTSCLSLFLEVAEMA